VQRQDIFIVFQTSRTACEVHRTSHSMDAGGFIAGGQAAEAQS